MLLKTDQMNYLFQEIILYWIRVPYVILVISNTKIIIVTKASCYGIKIFGFIDSETVFVLKVIIYTGKYMYASNNKIDMFKTVRVCCEVCKPFEYSRFSTVTPKIHNMSIL